ncbi:uncharacterized protein LOC133625979 [Colius striatus]|uniref:uncharacterized protein LOC133625979 n=1 Tax=Colius striatus TaxID=57412 RepID=UPI002B1E1F5E|nr:uncharacterized protein LOC133625979 [Colius striatus]
MRAPASGDGAAGPTCRSLRGPAAGGGRWAGARLRPCRAAYRRRGQGGREPLGGGGRWDRSPPPLPPLPAAVPGLGRPCAALGCQSRRDSAFLKCGSPLDPIFRTLQRCGLRSPALLVSSCGLQNAQSAAPRGCAPLPASIPPRRRSTPQAESSSGAAERGMPRQRAERRQLRKRWPFVGTAIAVLTQIDHLSITSQHSLNYSQIT